MNIGEPEAYDRVVASIYGAGLDVGKWPDVLAQVSTLTGHSWVALHAHDAASNANVGFLTHNYSQSFHGSYVDYFGRLNPWNARAAASPVGRPIASPALLPPDELRRTEFYNDWIRPQEDIGTGAGITLYRAGGRFLRLSCNIRFRDADKRLDDLVQALALLGPHLRRAFDLSRRLAGAGIGADHRRAFDSLGDGIFVLDGIGRCSFANLAAERLLRIGGLRLAGGVLELDGHARELGRLLHEAIMLRSAASFEFELADRCRYAIEVFPFVLDAAAPPFGVVLDGLPAALAVVRRAAVDVDAVAVLARRVGLTTAEQAVCRHLADGGTVQALVEARRVSVHTVRNQVRSVLEKAGVTRQAALVAMLRRLESELRRA